MKATNSEQTPRPATADSLTDVQKLVTAILADPQAVAMLRAGLAGADVQLIDLKETLRIAGISKSEAWRRISANTFPKPTKDLGPRCTRWSRAEVVAWAADRIAARQQEAH